MLLLSVLSLTVIHANYISCDIYTLVNPYYMGNFWTYILNQFTL